MGRYLVALVIVVALAAGGWLFYQRIWLPRHATQSEPSYETVTVQRGPIDSTVTATGSIRPEAEVSLAFRTPGVVTDVCVNITLMSAASRDYRVTAVTDGVATLWPDLQEACFKIWKRKFARLRTTEELVGELSAF